MSSAAQLSELLAGTLSADNAVREAATSTLKGYETQSFAQMAYELAGIVSADFPQDQAAATAQISIRTAAGLYLKNAIVAKNPEEADSYVERWFVTPEDARNAIKQLALRGLNLPVAQVATQAAQVVSAIAQVELPRSTGSDILPALLANMHLADGDARLRQATLQALGFISESVDPTLVAQHSNQVLTAIVQGARREETSNDVRLYALRALYNALEAAKSNFDRDTERHYIMQVVCEATTSEDIRVKTAAFEVMVRTMQFYYSYMREYMEKALYGLTVIGMKSGQEPVVLQAIEFWSTVCDCEIDLHYDVEEAADFGEQPPDCFEFAATAVPELVPVLLQLLTQLEDEEDDDDEWTVHKAAATCLVLLAQCTGDAIVPPVIPFIETNIRSAGWQQREAAVTAFGSILDGPKPQVLGPLVQQALSILIQMVADPVVKVRDTSAWTLGRVCDQLMDQVDKDTYLHGIVSALVAGLGESSKLSQTCSWGLMVLGDRLDIDEAKQTYPLSPYFDGIIDALLRVCDRADNEDSARSGAFETIATLVTNAPADCLTTISTTTTNMINRMQQTLAMQAQVVGSDERNNLMELQSNICSVFTSIIRNVGGEIKAAADQIMQLMLQLMSSAGKNAVALEDAFLTVGAMATAMDKEFIRYMDPLMPFIVSGVQNHAEHALCVVAVGLIGDVTRALGKGAVAYYESFMQLLFTNLASPTLPREARISILSTLGDIALATGSQFNSYMPQVLEILAQASSLRIAETDYDLQDYVGMLFEGIMDTMASMVQGFRTDGANQIVVGYSQQLFQISQVLFSNPYKTEQTIVSMVGFFGDCIVALEGTEALGVLRQDWVKQAIRDARRVRGVNDSQRDVIKWARAMYRMKVQG